MKKKIGAARVILRYFRKKLSSRFSWQRFMPAYDEAEQAKLREKSDVRRKIVLELAERSGVNANNIDEADPKKSAEADKARRTADLQRISQANNSSGSFSSGPPKKSAGRNQAIPDKVDTVLVEGVEIPTSFFASSAQFNNEDPNTMDIQMDDTRGTLDDDFQDRAVGANVRVRSAHNPSTLAHTQAVQYEPRRDLGFRGYNTPMRPTTATPKRVLSAIPLSRHLYPVKIETFTTLKAKTTSLSSTFSQIKNERPTTAPNFSMNNYNSPQRGDYLTQSMNNMDHVDRNQARKSKFYKEVDDNINRFDINKH